MNRRVTKKQTVKAPSLFSRIKTKYNSLGDDANDAKKQADISNKRTDTANKLSLLQRGRTRLLALMPSVKPVKRKRHNRDVNFSSQTFNAIDDPLLDNVELVVDDLNIQTDELEQPASTTRTTASDEMAQTEHLDLPLESKQAKSEIPKSNFVETNDSEGIVSQDIAPQDTAHKEMSHQEAVHQQVVAKPNLEQEAEVLLELTAYADNIKNSEPTVLNKGTLKSKLQQRKMLLRQRWHGLPLLHRRLITVLAPVLIVLLLLPTTEPAREQVEQQIHTSGERVAINLNTQSLSEQRTTSTPVLADQNVPTNPQVSTVWQSYKIKTGDTLAKVFRAHGLSMRELNSLVKIEGMEKPLSQIKRGQIMRFKLTKQGQLDMLQLEQLSSDQDAVMFFRLSDGSFGRNK